MKLSKNKSADIDRYILRLIQNDQEGLAKKASEAYGISENTVYRHLREMVANGWVVKNEAGHYSLKYEETTYKLSVNDYPHEDVAYKNFVFPFVNACKENVQKIWEYGFCEMFNNVIDHSAASETTITVKVSCYDTVVILTDNGVGAFEKIRHHFGYEDYDDAIRSLFAGKLTTDSGSHSGEGIFFTSQAFDMFALTANGRFFSRTDYDPNGTNGVGLQADGTTVLMRLSNESNLLLKDVFDKYADVDGGFTRTMIPVARLYESYPVSRSQARRLCGRFDNFSEVVLDFDGVSELGQGFAHELFSVYHEAHPNISLLPTNCADPVSRMLRHVGFT